MKYILVTGGVISGIGKGVVTSSIGALLKACNLRVTAIKIDPYLNVDAGTLSPYQHGEVYVLNDGCEVDLDLGNYERFLDIELKEANNITTGKINYQIYNRERQGQYLGNTITIVPHMTDTIQEWIEKTANASDEKFDVCIIELGGTIGDMEGMPFVEALRQLQWRIKRENLCLIHVTLVPCHGESKELKTKPTQQSVEKLRALGLFPDMIVCRSSAPVVGEAKQKISCYSGLQMNRIFSLPDLKTIYRVPIELEKQGLVRAISSCLNISACPCDRLIQWQRISDIAMDEKTEEIVIALVGKYTSLRESYTSISKSLEHACFRMAVRPKILYIDSELLEDSDDKSWNELKSAHCLIVPGGFGQRGIEGKIKAINWARVKTIPFLGICLGFQMAVVEYARNVLLLDKAHSAEFDTDLEEPLVIEMLEYKDPDQKMGGTMRLGLRDTRFVVENSILKELYGNVEIIKERHRHRYEINPMFIKKLEGAGLRFVGHNDDGSRMEILELDPTVHPYFVAVQYHPEFLSRPSRPSPPFIGLIQAAKYYKDHFFE